MLKNKSSLFESTIFWDFNAVQVGRSPTTFRRNVSPQLQDLVSRLAYSSTLKKKAIYSSVLVCTKYTTLQPEGRILHSHGYQNAKSSLHSESKTFTTAYVTLTRFLHVSFLSRSWLSWLSARWTASPTSLIGLTCKQHVGANLRNSSLRTINFNYTRPFDPSVLQCRSVTISFNTVSLLQTCYVAFLL
jgi:hypothetical protein